MREHLILFARAPEPGRVKSRLAAALGSEGALALYEAFLEDQVGFFRSLKGPKRHLEVCGDGRWSPSWSDRISRAGIRQSEQGTGDLGDRLARAFESSHRAGATATLVLGVDSPTLPAGHVLEAFRLLRSGAPAVVSPAEDGGYVLLGVRRPEPALLEDVPWGGSEVLAVTRQRAAHAGLSLAVLEGWYDVDDLDGLARLRADLAGAEAARRAPATARVLFRLDAPRRGML